MEIAGSSEEILYGVVREWAGRQCPGDDRAAVLATCAAIRAYASGASVSEACREAQRALECWSRHPSRPARARPPKRTSGFGLEAVAALAGR
jgi:hypothetical protein